MLTLYIYWNKGTNTFSSTVIEQESNYLTPAWGFIPSALFYFDKPVLISADSQCPALTLTRAYRLTHTNATP